MQQTTHKNITGVILHLIKTEQTIVFLYTVTKKLVLNALLLGIYLQEYTGFL